MTLRELAGRCSVSANYISMLELGRTYLPSDSNMKLLIKILKPADKDDTWFTAGRLPPDARPRTIRELKTMAWHIRLGRE